MALLAPEAYNPTRYLNLDSTCTALQRAAITPLKLLGLWSQMAPAQLLLAQAPPLYFRIYAHMLL